MCFVAPDSIKDSSDSDLEDYSHFLAPLSKKEKPSSSRYRPLLDLIFSSSFATIVIFLNDGFFGKLCLYRLSTIEVATNFASLTC